VDPKHLFVDERLKGSCVYCGGRPDTVDHVPSRVFLDDPLPENLSVVEACRECNGGFSLDEEYLVCLLECVMAGTTETDGLAREKVKRALSRNPRLTAQLEACRWDDLFGRPWWRPDEARTAKPRGFRRTGHGSAADRHPYWGRCARPGCGA